MFIVRAAKWLAVPQRSLVVLMSDLWILNLCLKLMADPTYCSLQLEHVIK